MALLVTSCTMGRHPRQLLSKGPEYLRTKTNTKLFTQHRRSAVELLAASKAQFVKSTVDLREECFSDNRSKLDTSRSERKSPRRSKSEYDLTKFEKDRFEENSDNNIDETVGSQRKFTAKPICCINGIEARKINMSNQNNIEPDISRNQQRPIVVKQSDGSFCEIVTQPTESTQPDSIYLDSNFTMSEEEKMVVDNVMTLSTDMTSTQEVDMDYKSSFVQRSHSDLSCQHSRNSSIVADRNSARFSRASADLEKFFNGMGIERNILDPMLRRQDNTSQRDTDIFESISSLDSPDTRSVCSGVSKLSEKTFSSSECLERTLQSTSVVERNARIIKWLCNIKKAKQPLTNE